MILVSLYRLKELINKEYAVIISCEGGRIRFSTRSVYLLVPKDVRERLARDFGIDLLKKQNDMIVRCDLMYEPQQGTVNLVYSFWKKESPQSLSALDREGWRKTHESTG
jgi:hypothetical protein